MALFNFRKNADLNNGAPVSAEPVESVEVLRKKTLHRLIGSAILVIAGVVGFSLVFDRQPRPIPVDIAIQIPGKDSAAPLVIGAPLATSAAPAASAPAAPVPAVSAPQVAPSAPVAAEPVAAKASLAAKEEIVPAAAKEPAKAAPVVAAAAPKEVVKPVAKEPVKEPAKESAKDSAQAEAERAKALLEGKATPEKVAVAQEGRFIVQVGAFADAAKARQARLKVEKTGLKTYTQVAETAEGKRIRVRVGPFGSRDEAEKAAKKIKSLDLSAAILTL